MKSDPSSTEPENLMPCNITRVIVLPKLFARDKYITIYHCAVHNEHFCIRSDEFDKNFLPKKCALQCIEERIAEVAPYLERKGVS